MKVFLDTNVLIDYLLKKERNGCGKTTAVQIMSRKARQTFSISPLANLRATH